METTNRKRLWIYIAIAYGVAAVMTLFMAIGKGRDVDLTAFVNVQMMYPACGVILGKILTRKKDEKLPSVRELATSLSINPNTIQKAYRELEQEGYIYTIAGKGSYAAEKADVASGRNEELMKEFDEIVKELLYLCEDKDILIKRIEELAKGGPNDDRSK